MVMGTRGKSTTVDVIAVYLKSNNMSVASRQTGLVPVIKIDEEHYYLRRKDQENEFDREMETSTTLNHYLKNKKVDALIIENNAISRHHMCTLNGYINPHIVVITTTSPDHILDQGTNPNLTSKIFLNSIPKKTKIIFWTNHPEEINAMKAASKHFPNIAILSSDLSERDGLIINEVYASLHKQYPNLSKPTPAAPKQKPLELVSQEITYQLPRDCTLINLGSVNDLLHTQMFLDEIIAKYSEPFYLLINFRADRDERTWLFMQYVLPQIAKNFDGVIIRSEHPIWSAAYIEKYSHKHFPLVINIPFETFNDFNGDILYKLPEKSVVIVLANTANEFGFELIQRYHLFQESYPILKDVGIAAFS